MNTAMLKRKLGAPEKRALADFLPTLGIKAKDFAAEMTSVNVQQKDLHGVASIEREHVDNNLAVRKMLLDRGIVPENMPAGEDIKRWNVVWHQKKRRCCRRRNSVLRGVSLREN